MVSCGKLSGVRFFVLEVRSWSGNDVPVNLYRMLFSILTRMAQLLPSEVPVLAKRQISVSDALRARSPDPAQLSLLREPGTHNPTGRLAPQATPTAGAGPRLHPMWTAAAIRSQRWRWGRGFMVTSRPGIRPMGVPSEGSGALWDTAPRLFPGTPQLPC